MVRDLTRAGAEVKVIMTESAKEFITVLTMETVSGQAVATDLFPPRDFVGTRHIDLAVWPDLVVIAPATANFLGKAASGISDDLLTTIVCATPNPLLVAPAMNPQMWINPVTQKNYNFLKGLGYRFMAPVEGNMACDHYGVGRMPEPDKIFDAIKRFFATKKKTTSKKKA
jgi:phosphopantothenoylcysteine decarboxylase/phosphopantothenate--cysteine ligase